MSGGLRGRMYLASGLLAAVLGATFAVLLLSIADMRASAELEKHSKDVLLAANRLERLIVDLETGLRGFVITRDERFLEPWDAARVAMPEQVSVLERLVADNPEQESRARRIAEAAASYVQDYTIPIVAAARQNLPSARSTATTVQGKQRLDAIRADFDRFGAVERRLSETRRDSSEAAARRSILAATGGLAGSVLLALLFSGYLTRAIVRPVRMVAARSGRLAGGDLSERMPEGGVGEIRVLEHAFNAMASSLEERQGELAQIAREQAALRRVATLVGRGASALEVFAAVTEEVGRVLPVDLTHMERFETDGTVSGIASWNREGDPIPVSARAIPQRGSVTASVLRTGRPSRTDSHAGTSAAVLGMGIRSSVGSPVVVDGRLWGVIIASSEGDDPLPPDTESRLTAFTDLVATAVSNAQARAELAASRVRIVTAADETRRRIERDLHDGSQQRLVSLGLDLRVAGLAVPPEMQELRTQLSRIGKGLDGVLEDLREISRGIHPAILSEGGLAPALKALARRSPVPVELDLRTDARFPQRVEVATYYVSSEALANAAKHARASLMHLTLEARANVLHLSIGDDGVGGADPGRGSGLIGLKDRVDALGGTTTITSPVGQGTSLVVELPIDGA